MSKIDFEFIECILTKLDFSYGKKQSIHDKIFQKIDKRENKISLNELDSVAGGFNSEILPKNLRILPKDLSDSDYRPPNG